MILLSLLTQRMADPKVALLKSPYPAWMKVSLEPDMEFLVNLPQISILPSSKTLRQCAIRTELHRNGYKEHMDSPEKIQ